MLENGLYDLRYSAGEVDAGVAGSGLAMLRDGKILGSDPWGGVFVGSCEFDPEARVNTVRLRFEVPPQGELITGFAAGPEGAVLDIVGAIADTVSIPGGAPTPSTVVDVAGAPVNVKLTYLGPLPDPSAPRRRYAGRRRPAARLHR